MKIDNSLKAATLLPTGRSKPRTDGEGTATASATDDVKLSALAGGFQSGDAKPPFDSARVQEIKQAIAEGRFSINAGAIADRLIDSARDLVSTQRKA